MCIQLYSEEDGKPDILQTAKRIAEDYCNDRITLDDIKVEYVDKALSGKSVVNSKLIYIMMIFVSPKKVTMGLNIFLENFSRWSQIF